MKYPEGYINKVICGDCLEVMKDIPDNTIDTVFADPDYNVGIKYDSGCFTKTFDEYMVWYETISKEFIRILKEEGNLFLVNYSKQNAYLRVNCLDKICYEVVDYIWTYNSNIGHSLKKFTQAHRSILHCRKSKNNKFFKENVAVPYKNPTDKRVKNLIANGSKGCMPYSWFYFDLVKNVSKDKVEHPCQLPKGMTELLIRSCTNEGDIMLDPFVGGGLSIKVCKDNNINFIGVDISSKYCDFINKEFLT